jgi:hypothetical protein
MPKRKGSNKTAAATRAKKEKALAAAIEQELEAAQADADPDASESEPSSEELSSEEESDEPCTLHNVVDCEDERCWWGEEGGPYSESFRAKLEAARELASSSSAFDMLWAGQAVCLRICSRAHVANSAGSEAYAQR